MNSWFAVYSSTDRSRNKYTYMCRHVWENIYILSLPIRCCSVTQLHPTLCDPMDCSMPGFPVITNSWSLLNLMSIESVMPSNHLILCRPLLPCLHSCPASGSFRMSQFFASGGQSIGVSASASILPMNIQDWFPLGLTSLFSLQFKRLSRIFSNTTVQKHQFFGTQSYLWSNSHIHTWLLEKLDRPLLAK